MKGQSGINNILRLWQLVASHLLLPSSLDRCTADRARVKAWAVSALVPLVVGRGADSMASTSLYTMLRTRRGYVLDTLAKLRRVLQLGMGTWGAPPKLSTVADNAHLPLRLHRYPSSTPNLLAVNGTVKASILNAKNKHMAASSILSFFFLSRAPP